MTGGADIRFEHDLERDRYVMTVSVPARVLAEVERGGRRDGRTLLELAFERALRDAGVVRFREKNC